MGAVGQKKNHRQRGAVLPRPSIGLVEWFRPGEWERVEQVLADIRVLSITHLRTGISWAEFESREHDDWFEWLLPRLAREVTILPCLLHTPPRRGLEPKLSSPPRHAKDYAEFLRKVIARFGDCFEWMELWNDPNNLCDWDWRLDPEWQIFCEMVALGSQTAHAAGKKTVLAGKCPTDVNWLRLLFQRGAMSEIDALGIHGFPGTWEFEWEDWSRHTAKVRKLLEEYQSKAELWITKTGFSTWRHDEHQQLRAFLQAAQAPVSRMYWYAARDLHPDLPSQDGFHVDERHYHFGLKRADNTPKLLFRLWAAGGLEAVRDAADFGRPAVLRRREERPILITGGCGFIGTNLAHRLLDAGRSVLLYDNLSRSGVENNLHWLREKHGAKRLQIEIGDVRDR